MTQESLININKEYGIKVTVFPDSQPHIRINKDISNGVKVVCSIINTDILFKLLLVADALKEVGITEKYLYISNLFGARYDRVMRSGDSFDLRVVANLINSCGFTKVYIIDPHSSVSTLLINNSKDYHPIPEMVYKLINHNELEKPVFIAPDFGATKKLDGYVKKLKNTFSISVNDIVYCNKHRDVGTGSIKLTVLDPEKCKDRNCVIMDDICDGGGTFIEIAKQLEAAKPKTLSLVVTHGIFSKGFDELKKYFTHIYTTNSLCKQYNDPIVKVLDLSAISLGNMTLDLE